LLPVASGSYPAARTGRERLQLRFPAAALIIGWAFMESERDILRRERAALRQRYGDLFDVVASILFDADPIDINYETNTDEYEPEAGTILPRLNEASTVDDVARIVHEEFLHWFGAEEADAVQNYQPVAARIWEAWQAFNRRQS
jgi:hypothetical protein